MDEIKHHILLVDDEFELRESIARLLIRKGFVVSQASCGNEAFNILSEQKIDLVITDVRMPNGNGVDLLKKIREKNPEIPVVFMMTGFANITEDDMTEDEMMAAGAQFVFKKPFRSQELIQAIQAALLK